MSEQLKEIFKEMEVHGTSVPGVLSYPKVTIPDTKFNKNGEYRTGLILVPDPAAAFIGQVEEMRNEAFEHVLEDVRRKKPKTAADDIKIADPSFKAEVTDEGEKTGNMIFNFKKPAKVFSEKKNRWYTFSVDLFNAKGERLSKDTEIWGGTVARIGYTMRPFWVPSLGVGVKFQLDAVKVLELVTRGERSADSYGFGEEEEGYDGTGVDEAAAERHTPPDENVGPADVNEHSEETDGSQAGRDF